MKKLKLLSFVLVAFISLFSFIPNVKALISDEKTLVNNFTLSERYNVTFRHYVIDENDTKTEIQSPEVKTFYENQVITLADNILPNVDYNTIEYYTNNTQYSSSTYTVTGDITFEVVYHLNRYTITYNLDGGTVTGNPTVYTEATGTITLNNPTKTDYIFLGWTWNGESTPQLNVSFNSTDKENKTFTANWQTIPSYTLKDGDNMRNLIPTNTTQVIFGLKSDYPNIASGSGTHAGNTSADLITLYTSGTVVYILADELIKFNADQHDLFQNRSSLTSIVFDNITTKDTTAMGNMFYGCSSLETLDLSSFDTGKLKYMVGMFRNATKLKTIYVSDSWSTKSVTSGTNVFTSSTKLVGGNGTTYNSSNITYTYARVDTATTPGYFTYKAN